VITGTPGWFKLGTISLPQNGYNAEIKIYGGTGYNAAQGQNAYVDLFIRTSNGSSTDGNGFAAAAYAEQFGPAYGFASAIKLVSNAAGTAATAYTVYVDSGAYIGQGFYTVQTSSGNSWTNLDVAASDPGVGSSTVEVVPYQYDVDNALIVQNSSGSSVFTVSTVNNSVTIGSGATGESTPDLLILDSGTSSSDPTGVAGAMYYNASMGQFRCYEQGYWFDCVGPTNDQSREMPFYSTDMLGFGAGEQGPFFLTNQGTGNVSQDSNDESTTHEGVVAFKGGSSTGGGYNCETDPKSFKGLAGYAYETVITNDTISSNTVERYGFFDNQPGTAVSNGAWIDVTNGVAKAMTSNGGTQTTGSTYTMATATWYRVRVSINSAGTVATFQIWDDTTGASLLNTTISTNIPAGATGAGDAAVLNTTGASTNIIGDDYQALWTAVPIARL
jgi:hypothetical protein